MRRHFAPAVAADRDHGKPLALGRIRVWMETGLRDVQYRFDYAVGQVGIRTNRRPRRLRVGDKRFGDKASAVGER